MNLLVNRIDCCYISCRGLIPEPSARGIVWLSEIAEPVEHAGAAGSHDDIQLGARIRMLRRKRKLSVEGLATLARMSSGMVSQIERGLSSPSLRSLRALSTALGAPLSWFFESVDSGTLRKTLYIVPATDRRLLRLTQTGVMKELLSPETDGRLIEMYELTLEAGGSSGGDFQHHEGEKAGMVLAGKFRLWLNEEVSLLGPGDSFQFPSTLPHRFDNPGTELARVLWINTPPMPRVAASSPP